MDQHENAKKTYVIKRSILINGHKTSVSLEDEFWRGLHEVAHDKYTTVPTLVGRSTAPPVTAIYRPQFAYSFSTIFGNHSSKQQNSSCSIWLLPAAAALGACEV